MPNMTAEAIRWHLLGYVPLPVAPDGTKRPAVTSWTAYQETAPDLAETVRLFTGDHDGIGVVCGAVSGGLEMLEVEGVAVTEGVLGRLVQAFADHGLGDLWARVEAGYSETTPSGGIHWYYRVEGGHAARNLKLARRPATDAELITSPGNRVRVLIETRGEGGFSVVAPSAARTHPLGLAWEVRTGASEDIPTLTTDERDAVHAIASTLDAMPEADVAPARPLQAVGGGLRPGDDYNARASWAEVLEPHGWKCVHTFGGNLRGWQRPGKRHPGVSATTGRNEADNLFVFSTATEFEPEKPYSKFSAYAILDHGGDFGAAARELRAKGYGEPLPVTPTQSTQIGASGDVFGGATDPAPPRLTVVDGANALKVQLDEAGARYGPTEDGLAQALADAHGDTLRYCPQRGLWLTWDGHRWLWDYADRHREHIRGLARVLPEFDQWRSFKRRALSASGVSGVARLAQSDPRLVVHIDQLDARPYEVNTPGGIVDLRTGLLRPVDPAALHTRSTGVVPDFDRTSDTFERFLASTFADDHDLTGYVQRAFGLAALGVVLEQLLFFAQGEGANGKSTLTEAVMTALGRGDTGYAIAAPAEMLMVRKHTEHPAELAQLAGARLVVCSELEEGQRFAEARVKQLTGRDSINARFMRQDPFTFTPSHTFLLLGNHRPDATTGGPAFWRRLRLIPFAHVVPEGKRDPRLGEKLDEDAPAVLAWIVRGAASYLAGGLHTPSAVDTATEAYAADQDTVGRFVEERCHLVPGGGGGVAQIAVTRLREAYEGWCRESGDQPVSARRLTQELRARFGVTSEQLTKGQRFYVGILPASDPGEGAFG